MAVNVTGENMEQEEAEEILGEMRLVVDYELFGTTLHREDGVDHTAVALRLEHRALDDPDDRAFTTFTFRSRHAFEVARDLIGANLDLFDYLDGKDMYDAEVVDDPADG